MTSNTPGCGHPGCNGLRLCAFEAEKEENLTMISKATAARASKPQPWRGFIKRFPRAILAVAKVSMYGTAKHEVPLDDMSYLTVPDADNMFAEAECRHLLKEAIEGPVDRDTGYEDQREDILHKAEKAWNAMADLERALYRAEKDLDFFARPEADSPFDNDISVGLTD